MHRGSEKLRRRQGARQTGGPKNNQSDASGSKPKRTSRNRSRPPRSSRTRRPKPHPARRDQEWDVPREPRQDARPPRRDSSASVPKRGAEPGEELRNGPLPTVADYEWEMIAGGVPGSWSGKMLEALKGSPYDRLYQLVVDSASVMTRPRRLLLQPRDWGRSHYVVVVPHKNGDVRRALVYTEEGYRNRNAERNVWLFVVAAVLCMLALALLATRFEMAPETSLGDNGEITEIDARTKGGAQ